MPEMGDRKRWRSYALWLSLLLASFSLWSSPLVQAERPSRGGEGEDEGVPSGCPLIAKEQRRVVASTESGSVSAVDVHDCYGGPSYHLRFITLEPNSLFLPVLLHTDMVFYVESGKGTVGWVAEGKTNDMEIKRGDVYRLKTGSVFYVRSYLDDPAMERLRIYAFFGNTTTSFIGPYWNLIDLIQGFDERVLRMGFGVAEEVAGTLKRAEKSPPIIAYPQTNETDAACVIEEDILELLVGSGARALGLMMNKNKKKLKPFNIFDEDPDVENCFGWSTAVTDKDLKAFKGSDTGFFVVNLTKGSMLAPHWNPMATEVAIVTQGEGMFQVVLPSDDSGNGAPGGQSTRFLAREGDAIVVPRYHPVAQMSFNNGSFVFVGFSTAAKKNKLQYLAGSKSVLQAVDKGILAMSFNVPNATIDSLLAAQNESIMMDCTSCAEEVERKMAEEGQRRREDEEEDRRKPQEEEEKGRQQEEEERRQQEEEEARRHEEGRGQQREEEGARSQQGQSGREGEGEEEAVGRDESGRQGRGGMWEEV